MIHLVIFSFLLVKVLGDYSEYSVEYGISLPVVTEIPIEDSPHHVSIQKRSRHICSGAIITHKHILTAGQCLSQHRKYPWKISVRTESIFHDRGGIVYRAERLIVHPYYRHPRLTHEMDYDFGIVVLDQYMTPNERNTPLDLPIEFDEWFNAPFYFGTGWIYKDDPVLGPSMNHSVLHSSFAYKVSNGGCYEGHNSVKYDEGAVTPRMICAIAQCLADIGAPIYGKTTLYGVFSWSNENELCNLKYYGVYSAVSYAVRWIRQMIEVDDVDD